MGLRDLLYESSFLMAARMARIYAPPLPTNLVPLVLFSDGNLYDPQLSILGGSLYMLFLHTTFFIYIQRCAGVRIDTAFTCVRKQLMTSSYLVRHDQFYYLLSEIVIYLSPTATNYNLAYAYVFTNLFILACSIN